jgi:hypothetical protein
LHKITEFYTEWFSVYPNITSKFCTIAIFKNCIKQNNDSNKTYRYDIHEPTVRYSILDQRRNKEILEPDMDPTEKKLVQSKQNLLDHVRRIKDIRYPKQLLGY